MVTITFPCFLMVTSDNQAVARSLVASGKRKRRLPLFMNRTPGYGGIYAI